MTPALEGITVADFTQLKQGPLATQKLAEMGAEVIKIEPVHGEYQRGLRMGGELLEGEGPSFLSFNRSKRSVTLDLKSDEGHNIAMEIVESADVVIENFRPHVMDSLGLGYEDVTEVNPDVVYVSSSSYGPDGPRADEPGQDLLMQSMSGLPSIGGRGGDPPTPAPISVVDLHGAMLNAFHVMTALFHREQTGEGQKVDLNLMDAAIDLQIEEIFLQMNLDKEFERSEEGIAYKYLGAPYGIYETADGHVTISMNPIDDLVDVLDLTIDVEYDSSEAAYENRDQIKREIEAQTREWQTDELLETLLAEDVWVSEVKEYEDMVEDPQVEHNEIICDVEHPTVGEMTTVAPPVSMSKTPPEIKSAPPLLGEHNEEVLSELGYDASEYERLVEEGVMTEAGSTE
ncbi:CaiB/BaiF CoA transferase family protein [Halobium palmae]|uniref:CaiB/BaiF CoA transferase family protein n=1 Tax=Halobium palmae TaxID=1776492 RepID=A0ABD5RWB9_9EURY